MTQLLSGTHFTGKETKWFLKASSCKWHLSFQPYFIGQRKWPGRWRGGQQDLVLEGSVNNRAQQCYLRWVLLWHFFPVPPSCLAAPHPKVIAPTVLWTCGSHFPPKLGWSTVCTLTPALRVTAALLPACGTRQLGLQMPQAFLLSTENTQVRGLTWLESRLRNPPLSLGESQDRESVTYFLLSAPFHLQKPRLFSSYYAEQENKMFSKRPGCGRREEGQGLVQNSDQLHEQMIPIFF